MRLSRAELVQLLQVALGGVREKDSDDGSIRYERIGPDEFEVSAFVRVGNSAGQGGCVLIQESENVRGGRRLLEEEEPTWPVED